MPQVQAFDPGQTQEATTINPQNLWQSQPLIQRQQDAFTRTFQNLMGRAPTSDEISSFFTQQYGAGVAHPDLVDPYSAAQGYTANAFGPQIADYNKQQQTDQLGKSQTMIQDLINKTMGNTAGQFSDPNSQLYQQFSGSMNNMGITPSSGAFQAGAGSTIANAGLEAGNAGLQSIGIPAIGNIAGTGNNPYQQAMGGPQAYSSQTQGLNNFEMQAQLAQMLQQMGQPSGIMQDLGMATGSAQGAGSLLQGGAAAKNSTSYVCLELIKRGLLCEYDMDDFHVHIMPAFLKKGRAFWKYAMDGKRLVDAVNAKGLDWRVFKPLLFDRVMDEPDPCVAVDLYADACHQLCISSDPSLWDGRVMRTSVSDSLLFLPLLFCYTPFLKAWWKSMRVRFAILYDKPRCVVHRS